MVLILSRSKLGKTALSKFFINHACKFGHRPMFIDLDPSNNLIGVKGSIGAGYC